MGTQKGVWVQPELTQPVGWVRWKRRARRRVGQIMVYGLMSILVAIVLIPVFWMLSTSLKERAQIMVWPPQWIPNPVKWENFLEVFRVAPFGLFIANSLILVVWNMVGSLLSCTLVAYGFARLRFRGREFLFVVLLATLMIPGQVTMIPTFILFNLLGWYNTFLPLVAPAFFGSAFFIFLMRQYMMTIPLDLDDAARMDGCGHFQVLWRILAPLCKPPLTIIAVFTFTGVWNDLMGPLIYLQDMEKFPVAVGLAMFQGMFLWQTNWGLLMAASFMAVLPSLFLYYVAQDHLIGGIASLGLKG
jgi:ABC-type glycerol-3-phosphate transport system permease component